VRQRKVPGVGAVAPVDVADGVGPVGHGTATAGRPLRREAGASGFDHYLVKPADPDALLQLLTRRVG
jgi:hypothetical protein